MLDRFSVNKEIDSLERDRERKKEIFRKKYLREI